MGVLKVSGTIDDYEIKNINLAPRKNEDKIISINKKIRDSIGKSGGDMVTVTLYLHDQIGGYIEHFEEYASFFDNYICQAQSS